MEMCKTPAAMLQCINMQNKGKIAPKKETCKHGKHGETTETIQFKCTYTHNKLTKLKPHRMNKFVLMHSVPS